MRALRLLMLGLPTAILALAIPLKITVSGKGSGSVGAKNFQNAAFTFTLTSDTASVRKPPCCDTLDTPSGTPTTYSIDGIGDGELQDTQAIYVTDGVIGLAHFNDGDMIVLTNRALNGYDLSKSIGPLTGTPAFVGSCPGPDCTTFQTDAGVLSFSRVTTVTFTVQAGTPPPLPTITNVVNGASFQAGIQGNSWISVFGTNFAKTARNWKTATEIVNGQLPTALDGIGVTVNGKAGSISYIGPTQINVLAPADDTLGPVQVTVTTPDGTSAPFTVQLKKPAPGFFLFDPQQRKYAAALIARSDGGVDYSGPEGLFGAGTATRPVKPGEILLLWGTGFGATDPAVPFGVVFSGAAPLTDTVTITIGDVPADVQFAGVTGAGLYQFNVVVPPLADGDQKVTATIDGVSAQDNVFVSVKN